MNFKNNKGREIVKLSLKLTLNEVSTVGFYLLQIQINIFHFKIFNGTTKLVPVEQKCTAICGSISSQIQIVKINVPRGFPTGGTLRSQVSKSVTGLEDTQSI